MCLRYFMGTVPHTDQMAIVVVGGPPSLQRFSAPALNLHFTSLTYGTVRGVCSLACGPQFSDSLVSYAVVVLCLSRLF